MTPNDPLFSSQWHLAQLGGIQTVWDAYSGQGVSVVVYDDGVEATHADLNDNYDPSGSFSFGGKTFGSTPISAADAHGTAVAGLIAAEAGNGLGGVGVAWGASIAALNFLEQVQFESSQTVLAAVEDAANFDVMNNSWGFTALYQPSQSLAIATSWAASLETAFETVAAGRGGLGTIIVQAAGNDAINGNGDGVNASRLTISVAAADRFGNIANFSNWGANILVTAPSAEVTTDRSGNNGFNAAGTLDGDPLADTNYTSVFGGTSAAAPIVSGVVALMLDADAGLGWRDVHNILALSAAHTGSALGAGPSGSEIAGWRTANSGDWNGGGTSFHLNYGFGMVDALAAVSMAGVWRQMHGAAQTSANERHATGSFTGAAAIADLGTSFVQASVSQAITVESVSVSVDMTHSFAADLVLSLIAPDGSEFRLMQNEGQSSLMQSGFRWTFGVEGARGLSGAGLWRLKIQDTAAGDSGVINSFQVDIHGSSPLAHAVQTFTDDFLALRALTTARGNALAGGGADWLNFAAVTGAIDIGLAAGQNVLVNGQNWVSLAAGSSFANLATGSGNDVVRAGTGDRNIHLGFGDDRVEVGNGRQSLTGGAGKDTLSYAAAAGTVTVDLLSNVTAGSWAADDSISGFESAIGSNLGNDTLRGTNGDNLLTGLGGNDTIFDRAGNDLVDLGDGLDFVLVGNGRDTLAGGAGLDYISYFFAPAGVSVDLLSDVVAGSWAADDVISGFERVIGSNLGHDTLRGTDGDNIILSHGGNDMVFDRAGNDLVNLLAGDDMVFVGGGRDTLVGGTGNDEISYFHSPGGVSVDLLTNALSGSWAADDAMSGFERVSGSNLGHDTLRGSNGANIIFGNGGNDIVYDRAGDDLVDLGGGHDTIVAGGGSDTLAGGAGIDEVSYFYSPGGVSVDLRDQSVAGSWAADDTVSGFERVSGSNLGNDSLTGGNDDNILRGNGGADLLDGQGGADILDGGSGNDALTGGFGADAFVFRAGYQADTLADFLAGDGDRLLLDDTLWSGLLTTLEIVTTFAQSVGGSVRFDFGAGDILMLAGISDLTGIESAIDII